MTRLKIKKKVRDKNRRKKRVMIEIKITKTNRVNQYLFSERRKEKNTCQVTNCPHTYNDVSINIVECEVWSLKPHTFRGVNYTCQ